MILKVSAGFSSLVTAVTFFPIGYDWNRYNNASALFLP